MREGHSAGSWRGRLLPSLAAWPRDAAVPGEHGDSAAPGFAVAQGRKVPGGKGRLPRRAGMELNSRILKCCDCGNRKPTAGMGSQEAPGTTAAIDQLRL